DPPGKVTSGSIKIGGMELVGMQLDSLRQIRGKDIGMIFQEPMTSLNPVFTVGEQIAESVRLHENASPKAAMDRAVEMLKAVDIPEAERRARAYPHQLSGGMRQRVMIAMALACRPKVLIADEPTTALDATVQAQIFDLLQDLQEETGTAIILITHDMGAIAELADAVAVMYAGRVVEKGTVDAVLSAPQHPYTKGLITCVPHLEPDPPVERHELMEIPGVVPALTELGKGCAFAPRCGEATEKCSVEEPQLLATGDKHLTACWVAQQERAQ
ncbi:MAG: ABC transporter ATP-binding protein, partial [Rhodospirillales bacterium]|nr:ABC transporter ATP-binding protein [Rhodospirillales bacterium]